MLSKLGGLVALALTGLPDPGPRERLPGPGEAERHLQGLTDRSLARTRQLLITTERNRAQVEQWQRDGDPRFDPELLETYKQQEAAIRRLVRALEPIRFPTGGGLPR